MAGPTPSASARRVGAVLERHRDHRDILQRRGMADRSRAAEKRFVRPRRVQEKHPQRFDARASDCMVNGRDLERVDRGIDRLGRRRLAHEILGCRGMDGAGYPAGAWIPQPVAAVSRQCRRRHIG
jgi:hypothetical protein